MAHCHFYDNGSESSSPAWASLLSSRHWHHVLTQHRPLDTHKPLQLNTANTNPILSPSPLKSTPTSVFLVLKSLLSTVVYLTQSLMSPKSQRFTTITLYFPPTQSARGDQLWLRFMLSSLQDQVDGGATSTMWLITKQRSREGEPGAGSQGSCSEMMYAHPRRPSHPYPPWESPSAPSGMSCSTFCLLARLWKHRTGVM